MWTWVGEELRRRWENLGEENSDQNLLCFKNLFSIINKYPSNCCLSGEVYSRTELHNYDLLNITCQRSLIWTKQHHWAQYINHIW